MRILSCLAAAALLACAHSSPPSSTATSTSTATSEPAVTAAAAVPAADPPKVTSVEAQVAEGATLFSEHCAKCHGTEGQGSKKAPPVVGPTALPLDPLPGAKKRTMPFRTAGDVLKFIKKYMPNDDPGSLTDDQYNAILAFDLKANGAAPTKPINADTAAGITLH